MADLNDESRKTTPNPNLQKSVAETKSGRKIPKGAPKQADETDNGYAQRRMKEEWDDIKHPGE